jgi:hypothetical protein
MNSLLLHFSLVPIHYRTSEFIQNSMKSLDIQGHLFIIVIAKTNIFLLYHENIPIKNIKIKIKIPQHVMNEKNGK